MECSVLRVDAFTKVIGQGNPAGVVLNGDQYSTKEMQEIAKKVGFNETVFCCTSDHADIKLRYFTPRHETPLCGHATMGSIFALYHGKGNQKRVIETKAGLLSVDYNDEQGEITMTQAEPKFIDFMGDKEALCRSLGIEKTDLDPSLPIQYGNTGSWTLLVPVKNETVLDMMSADTQCFPKMLTEMPKASVHPFAVISKEAAVMTARHFSSPFSGTKEDSVTGTASGVMGAYALNHIYLDDQRKEITVFQGKHVNRSGQVLVDVIRGEKAAHSVRITGTACLNEEIKITLDE